MGPRPNTPGNIDPVTRVLIVDDSAYVRKCLKEMLSRSPFLEVVGAARNGVEALELVEQLAPDVMTIDLDMPQMGGLEFLDKQMSRHPLPAIVVSSAEESGELVLQALELGAVDVVQKPTALATERIFEVADDLIAKVKAAAVSHVRPVQPPAAPAPPPRSLKKNESGSALPEFSSARKRAFDVIVVGISTGGPQGLKQFIPRLPANLPVPLAVVIHMPLGYTEYYARNLNEIAQLEVAEAREGDILRPGVVLLAPAGRHLTFRRLPSQEATVHLDLRPIDTPHRPAVDVLFQSAAKIFGKRALGIVMTGMGSDGTQGAAWIKAEGGTIFTEAEESCVVYGMPRAVVEAGLSDRVVALQDLAEVVMEVLV